MYGKGVQNKKEHNTYSREIILYAHIQRDYIVYLEYHHRNWVPPPPPPPSEGVSPLEPKGGGGNTFLRVRECGEPIRTTG
jgi:hypothetical protein